LVAEESHKVPELSNLARQAAKRIWYFGNRYSCPVCHASTRVRHTYSFDLEVNRRLDVVRGEYVANDDCPICYANQRIRLTYAALKGAQLPDHNADVLHIAPELALYERLFRHSKCHYVPIDLVPERYANVPNVQYASVTALPFESDSFDLILCNHVLEHVPDDRLAMRELRRVLRMTGLAFLQVPISTILQQTIEDPSVIDPEERARKFGQFDHVRIYSELDYVSRLKDSGFEIFVGSLTEVLSEHDILTYELNPRERLIVAGCEESIGKVRSRWTSHLSG
jgi:SAM-dependent methyltransferase